MAVRFSGSCTVRVRILDCGGLSSPALYRATVSVGGRNVYSCNVGAAPAYRGPVDAPEEFDSVARAALAFADHDSALDSGDCDWGYSGPIVTRREVRA